MSITAPPVIVEPFAINGLRNAIPTASQIPITPGAASYNDGFPPLTMVPLNSGGVPPAGRDMNGILYAVSAHSAWQQGGGSYTYDSTFSAANGGYGLGAVLQSAVYPSIFWRSLVDGNTNNPDVTPTNWTAMLGYPVIAAESGVTIVNIEYPWGDIRRYGALTSNADNATYIVRAITQNSAGGFPVYIPPGTWLSGQIAIASNITITGAGKTSIIKSKNASNNYLIATTDATVYHDNVLIQDIAIDGNKTNNTSGGGIYLNGRGCIVRRCYVHDTVNAGIQSGAPSNGGTDTPLAGNLLIVGNEVKNCGKSNNWGQVAVTHGTNVMIEFNLVWCDDGASDYGVDLEANSGNILANITVANNIIAGGNVQVDGVGCGTGGATNIILANNVIDRGGSYVTGDGTNKAPIWIRQARFLSIEANTCWGHPSATFGGIVFDSSGITATYSVSSAQLIGNSFYSTKSTVRSGVFQAVSTLSITGNTWLVNSSSSATEFTGSGSAIRGAGNVITNLGAGAAVNIGAGTNIVFDRSNALTGTVPTPGGTQNSVELPDLWASTTWSPGTIANNAGSSTQVTVTGISRSNGSYFKSAVLTTLGTGQVLSGGITNTDELTVALQNYTGSPVTPSSGTLTVRCGRIVSSAT